MEPFAYQKPRSSNSGKLILMLLAGASFSVWFLDLIPQLADVDTGQLDPEEKNSEADFLAMLDSPVAETAPDVANIVDHKLTNSDSTDTDLDPLMAALESQTEPIENSFPEFARLNRPADASIESAATDLPDRMNTGIQQAGFRQTTPAMTVQTIAPVVLDPETAAQLRTIDEQTAAGETLKAHASLSNLYWKQPDVRPLIQERMEATAAQIYANPNAHFAEPYVVQFGDTLDGIARKHKVPWQYLARLNGVTAETLQAGQTLKVLTGPFAAVIDLQKFELTVHAHGWFVRKYRIGIGRDQRTPTGDFVVQNKLENPKWYDPQGGQVDGDDPSNPLGEYWLGLGDHIGIHGTIDPDSIGKASSRGCIHLADDDIAEVYQLLGTGSEVRIRP